jgi:hypothetical protein
MAKKPKRITDAVQNEPRADVTWRHVGLLSAFAVLLIVSVFTVLIPELTDDGSDEEADANGSVTAETPPASAVPPASSASAHTP